MKKILTVAALALVLASGSAAAFNRESGYGSEKENSVAECMADPQCVATLRRTEMKRQASQAAWEKKSLDQKIEPYFWMVAGFAALWFYLGRKK